MKNILKTLVKDILLTVIIVFGTIALFSLALHLSSLMNGTGF